MIYGLFTVLSAWVTHLEGLMRTGVTSPSVCLSFLPWPGRRGQSGFYLVLRGWAREKSSAVFLLLSRTLVQALRNPLPL